MTIMTPILLLVKPLPERQLEFSAISGDDNHGYYSCAGPINMPEDGYKGREGGSGCQQSLP